MQEQVMAYYLSDDGMGKFLLNKKNVFLRMDRTLQQHRLGNGRPEPERHQRPYRRPPGRSGVHDVIIARRDASLREKGAHLQVSART